MKTFFSNPWVIGAMVVMGLIAIYYLFVHPSGAAAAVGGDSSSGSMNTPPPSETLVSNSGGLLSFMHPSSGNLVSEYYHGAQPRNINSGSEKWIEKGF